MRKATSRQWIVCGIVTLLYLLFLVWVKSWWGLIVVPFIFDVYISKKIPWTFWKRSENQLVRTVMSWVDAIVFALVAVYFVNIYFFQNYQIPSSSLEKSLLVGDFLFVSKMSYGPRVPNTPLSMPLTQHTLPVVETKSYIDWPRWPYKRVKGFGEVQLNDIVVFNFPAGDTVALLQQNRDYESICYELGREKYQNTRITMDSLSRAQQRLVYEAYYNEGRKRVLANPALYGEVVSRPVDRRENYVKRCVGLPGDTLQIVDRLIYLNGKAIQEPENVQFSYFVQTTGQQIPMELFRELGISNEDIRLRSKTPLVYYLPLTHRMRSQLLARKDLVAAIEPVPDFPGGEGVYPQNLYNKWGRHNYGPVWIPKKGETIQLTMDNYPIYERAIRVYENNRVEIKENKFYINGEQQDSYTFRMDYYWMMGDNRDNSADSRYWGFVPEDHVVGKPILVWLSLDKDRGWFDGKIRWSRLFKWVDAI